MLADYIEIDFEAIREKLADVIYAVAGSAVDVVVDVTEAIEDVFYDVGSEPKVSIDIEALDLNQPFKDPASIEPWLRQI